MKSMEAEKLHSDFREPAEIVVRQEVSEIGAASRRRDAELAEKAALSPLQQVPVVKSRSEKSSVNWQ